MHVLIDALNWWLFARFAVFLAPPDGTEPQIIRAVVHRGPKRHPYIYNYDNFCLFSTNFDNFWQTHTAEKFAT